MLVELLKNVIRWPTLTGWLMLGNTSDCLHLVKGALDTRSNCWKRKRKKENWTLLYAAYMLSF